MPGQVGGIQSEALVLTPYKPAVGGIYTEVLGWDDAPPLTPASLLVRWGVSRIAAPLTYRDVVLADGSVMYLPMDEGTGPGSTAVDATGNAHNAVLGGTATLVSSGLVGTGSYNSNGSGFAVVNYGSWMDVPTFSIDAVVQFTNTQTSTWQMVTDRDRGTMRVYQFGLLGNGSILWLQTTAGPKFAVAIVAHAGSIPFNQKAHIGFTYNNGTVKLYANGYQVGSTGVGFAISGASPIAIGNGYGGSTGVPNAGTFSGSIDEVNYYNTELSAARMLAHAQVAGVAGPTPVVRDTFYRANSTNNMGSTEIGGGAWTAHVGTWGISNYKAYESSGANATNYATVQSGVSDCTVSVELNPAVTYSGLIIRSDGAGNHLVVQANIPSGVVDVIKYVGGASAGTVATTTFTVASGDALSATMSGSSIIIKVNGITKITTSSTSYTTQTRHGLWAYGASSAQFSNFTVTVP